MVADSPRPGPSATSGPVNLKQAAARLDVHYMTVYRYVRQGKLPATRAGTAWLVTETAITDFLARRDHRTSPRPPGPEDRAVDWADRLVLCLLAGDEPAARRVVDAALASGHPAEFCYIDMLGPAMGAIGARWEAGEISVADQHIATAVATRVVAHLGVLAHRPGRSRGTVVFGAPSGELHSLPISIAADLVRLAGFDVLELGANVPPEAFALAGQRASRLVAIGIGVTAGSKLAAAQAAIDAIRQLNADVPIVMGGQAAISAASAGLLGVTAWAANGPEAVALIESLARTARRGRRSGQLPHRGQQAGGQGRLDGITGEERGQPERNGPGRADVEAHCEPGHPDGVHHDLAGDHGRNRLQEGPVGPPLRQPPAQTGGQHEADDVAE